MKNFTTQIAILIAGLLISIALTFGSRYQIARAQDGIVFRLDKLAGSVDVCVVGRTADGRFITHCDGRRVMPE